MGILTQDELFEARRSGLSDGTRNGNLSRLLAKTMDEQEQRRKERKERRQEVERLLAIEPEDERSSFSQATDILKTGGSKALQALQVPFGVVGEVLGDATRPVSRRIYGALGASDEATEYLTRDVRGLPTSPAEIGGVGISELKNSVGGPLGAVLDTLNVAGSIGGDPLTYLTLGSGTAARGVLRGIGGGLGDDVAKAVARRGAAGGDELLVQTAREAAEQAAAREVAERAAIEAGSSTGRGLAVIADEVIPPGALGPGYQTVFARTLDEPIGEIGTQRALDAGRLGLPPGPAALPGLRALGSGPIPRALGQGERVLGPGVGPLGALGQAGLRSASGVVDDVGRRVASGGDDLLGGVDDLAAAAAPGPPTTIREFLLQQGGNLGREGSEAAVDRQIALLNRRAGGGIGILGHQTGFGGRALDALGDRALSVTSPVRSLLSPTARIADEFGGGAAGAVRQALNTGGNSNRAARKEFRRQYADGSDELAKAYREELPEIVNKAMVDDLTDLVPRLVSTEAGPGLVQVADKYVPQVVADAFNNMKSAAPNDIVKWTDAATRAIKMQTTLNPALNPIHVPRNIMSNILLAAMYGGVRTPKYWIEARQLRSALAKARTQGEPTVKALKDGGLTDLQARRAMALHDQQLVGRGHEAFDDVGLEVVGDKKFWLGKASPTAAASRLNSWHEELSRGAVFLKGLDDNLKPQQAWQRSSDAMLDYSSEGLSKFERDYLQRLIFFYKFPRRAIPRGVRFMAETPGAASALTQAGVGVGEGERNQFGLPIGLFADSPLEAVGNFGAELFNDDGDFDPINSTIEDLHPVLRAALDPEERGLEDIVPPVGMAAKSIFEHEEQFALRKLGLGLLGIREGEDYEKIEWEEDAARRLNEKGEISKTDNLIIAAEKAGVERPYGLSDAELVQALLAKGVGRRRLEALVND